MIRPRQLHQQRHLSTSNCNHRHAKLDMEKKLTALIKENSLCNCKDCSKKKEDKIEKELTKLFKKNNLCDCKECNTKEEDTKEVELHNEDNDGVISPGTSYSNSIHTAEASTGNTEEEDSNMGEYYNEDSDSAISSNTLYNEDINT